MIIACNSEYKYQTLHSRLLQDKEMTVRRDCDQSQQITLTCWLTLSLFVFVFAISIIILIFNRDLNYIHYRQCLTHVCKLFHRLCKGFVPLLL